MLRNMKIHGHVVTIVRMTTFTLHHPVTELQLELTLYHCKYFLRWSLLHCQEVQHNLQGLLGHWQKLQVLPNHCYSPRCPENMDKQLEFNGVVQNIAHVCCTFFLCWLLPTLFHAKIISRTTTAALTTILTRPCRPTVPSTLQAANIQPLRDSSSLPSEWRALIGGDCRQVPLMTGTWGARMMSRDMRDVSHIERLQTNTSPDTGAAHQQ